MSKSSGEIKSSERGRPKIDPDKRRLRRIVTFVTEAQYEQLESLALRKQLSISFVVYRMVVRQLESNRAFD